MTEHLLDLCRVALDLPHLSGRFAADWASRAPGHREALRKGLIRDLRDRGCLRETDRTDLADLSRPPELAGFGVSISHSPLLGGYLISERARIGLDIEEKNRLRRDIVARVCSQDEIAAAPHWSFLWSAKEAAYKALPRDRQPPVISEISVLHWRTVGDGAWRYEAALSAGLSKTLGVGLIFDSPPHFFSVFRLHP